MHSNKHRGPLIAATVLALLGATACSPTPGAGDGASSGTTSAAVGSTGSSSGPPANPKVVLVTHDSWAVPDGLLATFTAQTGYSVTVLKTGDAGELTNKLVLTKDNPIGDVAYGVDNTFASRAIDAGVFTDYASAASTSDVDRFRIPAAPDALTPVDWGDVCVNVDDTWFAKHGIAPPATMADLATPRYRGLFVTEAATTSSPGLAFLLATIAAYGESGAFDFWKSLVANGMKIDAGWEKAYYTDFTAGGGGGAYPIVLSYNSDPVFSIPDGKTKPTTRVLLDSCFRQVEYVGVLTERRTPREPRPWWTSCSVATSSSILPDNMYVFPVRGDVSLPAAWAKWAPVPSDPLTLDPATIAANRDQWLKQWVDATSG